MKRRQFLGSAAGLALAAKRTAAEQALGSPASCAVARSAGPGGGIRRVGVPGYGSKVKITNVKVFGVSLTPVRTGHVFAKLETDAD
jgi:hypothetical protein